MYVALIVTIAVFFGVKFLASRFVKKALANAAGAGAVVFLLIGILIGNALFGNPPPPAVPVSLAAPAAPAAPPNPVAAPVVQLAPPVHLSAEAGFKTRAVIDGITSNAILDYGPLTHSFPLGSTIFVRGWAVSADRKPVKRLIFIIDHRLQYDGTAKYGIARPDIVQAFDDSALLSTGFSDVALTTHGLAAGTHLLQVGASSPNSTRYQLSTVNMHFVLR